MSNLLFFFGLLLILKIFDSSSISHQTKIRMGNNLLTNCTQTGNETPSTNPTSENNEMLFSIDLTEAINELDSYIWYLIIPELKNPPLISFPHTFPMNLFMFNKFPIRCAIYLEYGPPDCTTEYIRNKFLDKERGGILGFNSETEIMCRYHACSLDIRSDSSNYSSFPRYAVLNEKDFLYTFHMGITFPSVEFLAIYGSISSTSIEKISKLFPNLIHLVIYTELNLVEACDFGELSNLRVLYISNLKSSHPKNKHSISVGPLKELYVYYSYFNFLIDGSLLTGEFTKL
jgi:hypothetical protein